MVKSGDLLLTVIITVYNCASYLDKCIESVINQTYKNVEIILVNDGSIDNSGKICDKYAGIDKRIVVIHQENAGLVSARQRGVENAKGDVIAFVDADDWVESTMYECMMSVYMSEKPDMVTSGLIWEWKDRQEISLDIIEEGTYEKEAIISKVLPCLICDRETRQQGITASLCNKLFNRSRLQETIETADTQLTFGEDGAIVYGFVRWANRITIIHNAWYHYVQHEKSMINGFDLTSFEKIYRLKKALLNTFVNEEGMKEQINAYVRGFLYPAVKSVFELEMGMISYVFPYECIPVGSRIILYGAGCVGYSYYKCVQSGNYVDLVAWVDKNYVELQKFGLPVDSIENSLNLEYDYIVIAVNKKELAEEIRENLKGYNIDEDKVIWK